MRSRRRPRARGEEPDDLLGVVAPLSRARNVIARRSPDARLLAATPIPTLLLKLPGRLGSSMAMLASTDFPLERAKYVARGSGENGSVALLLGCVMEGLFTETNRATERVLTRNDYTMIAAPNQGCCGALHAHAGALGAACSAFDEE